MRSFVAAVAIAAVLASTRAARAQTGGVAPGTACPGSSLSGGDNGSGICLPVRAQERLRDPGEPPRCAGLLRRALLLPRPGVERSTGSIDVGFFQGSAASRTIAANTTVQTESIMNHSVTGIVTTPAAIR